MLLIYDFVRRHIISYADAALLDPRWKKPHLSIKNPLFRSPAIIQRDQGKRSWKDSEKDTKELVMKMNGFQDRQ